MRPLTPPDLLQFLKWIAAWIVAAGALGDAVADEGDFDWALGEGADRYKKCDDQDW